MTNGCWWSTSTVAPWTGGGAAHIIKGHLTNCVLSGNRNYHNYGGTANGGGALFLGGGNGRSGTVSNCKITGNISTNNGGGGVKVCYGGPWLLDNCELSYNETTNSSSSAGGALNAYVPVDLELRDCQIFSNVSRAGGGGVSMSTGGRLTRCRIYGNMSRASGGGGAYLGNKTLARNCLIYNNTCLPSGSSIGGGVYFPSGTNGLIQNCTIYSNTSTYGGGIGFYNSTSFVENCVLWGNEYYVTGPNYWLSPRQKYT